MNKVASEIFSFFDVGGKQVKVSRKDFITVSFWDLWLSSQKAMKSVPTGKAGLEDIDAELIARGISKERIKHYGFAFEGKNVLIAQA